MGESRGGWGDLAEQDDELAEVWDAYERLPEPGENAALDAFCEAKNITIASLMRLGARLSDPLVLAFPYQAGIKYRNVETGQRWAYHGSEFVRLKLIPSGSNTDTVIVAESETDAARLTLLYPRCDIAVLPAGAKRFTPAFAEQLMPYRRVLVGLDNDEAGDVGAAKIAEQVPHAVRFAPPEGTKDWCEVDAAPPLPDVADQPPRCGGIVFEDLASRLRLAIDGKLPPVETIVDDLLYASGVHWLSGHPGSGKSIMALSIAQMVMGEGRPVVWIDYENGLDMTVRRMADADMDFDLAVAQFHYAWYPQKAETYLDDIAEAYPGALVVIDSASKALQLAGIDENSPGEVTAWTVPIIRACKANSMPALVIDHVTKATKPRENRYARGAGAKLADADVHLMVEVVEEFTREQQGLVCLHRAKDREGYLPLHQWYRIGDGKGKLPVLPTDPPADIDAPDEPSL